MPATAPPDFHIETRAPGTTPAAAFDEELARGVGEGRITVIAPRRCHSDDPAEIVVCAPDPEQFRLRAPGRQEATGGIGPAAIDLNGVGIAVENEAASVGGFTSNRMMLRAKIKF